MSVLLGIVGWFNPKRLLMLGAAIVVSVGIYKVVDFVDDKYKLEQQVFEQQVVIQQRDATIRTKEIQLEAAREAARIAEQTLEEARKRAVAFEGARTRVINTNPDQDAPIAPVVEEALDIIRARRGVFIE